MDLKQLKRNATAYIVKKGKAKQPRRVKKRLRKEKQTEILFFLHKYAINTSNETSYTLEELEMCLEEISPTVQLSPLKEHEEQLSRVIEALRENFPLDFQ